MDDRRRDGGTNLILKIKELETRLTLHEHDDVDDDDDTGEHSIKYYKDIKFICIA